MITKIDFPAAPRKAAIVTFGTRLTLYTAGIRKVGLIYLREYIMNVLGRTQVDYVSKKSGKEAELDYYRDIRDTDLNDYDELWIFHSPFNPFGGVFKESALITFDKMVDYKGEISKITKEIKDNIKRISKRNYFKRFNELFIWME